MSATHQFCTFHVHDLFIGVAVLQVQEVIRYRETAPVPLASPVVEGLINLRGQIVTAIDLRRRLDLPERAARGGEMLVIVRTADGVLALVVDAIGDVIEVGDDTFEPPPQTLRGETRELVTGVHKLPQQLLHVLDVEKAALLAA